MISVVWFAANVGLVLATLHVFLCICAAGSPKDPKDGPPLV